MMDESASSLDRVSALLDAVVSVSSDLDLPSTLTRIVRAACRLAGARYGALGVLSPDRTRLSQFVTEGVSDDLRARIGHPPEGHGILGLLIDDPRPLRLHDITADPRAYGFPAEHPPMRSFLGVPVRTRDTVFGNLYLTEKLRRLGLHRRRRGRRGRLWPPRPAPPSRTRGCTCRRPGGNARWKRRPR